MFSKDMLIGIILSSSKMDFNIERDDNAEIGYRVRMKLLFRAEKCFIDALGRSLAMHGISFKEKQIESKARPRPILSIGSIKDLFKVITLVPDKLPDAKDEWHTFRRVVNMLANHEHKTSEGLDKIFELKGVI